MKEMHSEIINTLEGSFDELEANRLQMKEIYRDALKTIDTRIEEMKGPTPLYKRLFERNLDQLAVDKRRDIQGIKQDITQVEQQLATIINDQEKLVALKNAPDIPAHELDQLRSLEAYYQNGHLSDTPADLEAQRQQLQATYTRHLDIPRRLTDLSTVTTFVDEAEQNLLASLDRYFRDNRDLTRTQHQALGDLSARYVQPGEQLRTLKSASRLEQGDIPTIVHLDNEHQARSLLGEDRIALHDLHERYIGAQQKIRDLLDNDYALPEQLKSSIAEADHVSQERALTDDEYQSIRGHYERYAIPFKQLAELKKISQVNEADRRELAHIENEYYHNALNDDMLGALSQIHDHYTQRYSIPGEQLKALQQSEHIVYSDQQLLKEISTAFRQDRMTDVQHARLHILSTAYSLPMKLLSELTKPSNLSEQDRDIISRLDTAHQRGPLTVAEVNTLRDIHEHRVTQANELQEVKQASQIPLDDLQDLVHLSETYAEGPLSDAQRDRLTQLHESYASTQPSIGHGEKRDYGNIYKEYERQIQQKKYQLSIHEERLQAVEARRATNGSLYVKRKLYEFKTRSARTWFRSEIQAIENKERITTSLPSAVRQLLRKTDAEKNLKELHKAETDVLRQWENIDYHVEQLTYTMRSLLQNESMVEDAMKQRDIDRDALKAIVREHQELKDNFTAMLERYHKAINSETLVNVHQSYHNTLNKYILGPTKNIVSNTHKIEELEYVITATKEYADALQNIAAARNSLVSKITYLTGRTVENMGAGFTGGVGSAFVRNGLTPTTNGGGGGSSGA